MNEEERKKLVEKRKKEQAEKEMEYDIAKHLNVEEKKNDLNAISEKERNKYVEAALLFFGTLLPLYTFVFCPVFIVNYVWGSDLRQVGLPIGNLLPWLHAAFIIAGSISAYRGKSLLDSFFEYFSKRTF